jgi:type II secretory ATPase GspE/PulE/Tfp pilus assembly ATPase PilB-like protein
LTTAREATINGSKQRLGDMLLEKGIITNQQLNVAIAQQKLLSEAGHNRKIGDILLQSRFISPLSIQDSLSLQNKESESKNNAPLISLLPFDLIKSLKILPVSYVSGLLTIESVGILSNKQIENIISTSSREVNSVKVLPMSLFKFKKEIGDLMTITQSTTSALENLKEDESGYHLGQAIQSLLSEAISKRSSDMHLFLKADPESWISYRIDGVLRPTHLLSEKIMRAIFVRIKSMANMDASNTVSPQDGRIAFSYGGRSIDFRVAVQPTADGEKMVLRSLDPANLPEIKSLFPYQPNMVELFTKITSAKGKQGGITLISGPTGSGKSTTLFALTQMLPRDSANVITLEDPVEYYLPMATQIQINQLLEQQATGAERSVLRQDPDFAVIGEVRDTEFAFAGLKFAESGHPTFGTIHAGSAIQTIDRFISFFPDASKESALYVLASYLDVIINQKLVSRLCPLCSVKCDENKNIKKAKKGGCRHCSHTGYHGRIALHETLIIPKQEEERERFISALLKFKSSAERDEGAIDSLNDIKKLPGVIFISRAKTAQTLIEHGLVDYATVKAYLSDENSLMEVCHAD